MVERIKVQNPLRGTSERGYRYYSTGGMEIQVELCAQIVSSVYGFFPLSFIHAIFRMLNYKGFCNTIAQPQIYLPDARTTVDSTHLSIPQVRPRQTRLLRATRHSSRLIWRDSYRLFAADAQTVFLGNGPIDRYLSSDLVRQVSVRYI